MEEKGLKVLSQFFLYILVINYFFKKITEENFHSTKVLTEKS